METRTKNNTIISVLTSAGLATALISWIATAQGLQKYAFDQWWQAIIISGAIQSALFACNMKGPFILKRLGKLGKAIFILFFIMVLLASSTFSFVYIESVAYPDELLRDDANRILADNGLIINYMMDTTIEEEKKKVMAEMNHYISVLSSQTENKKNNETDYSGLEMECGKLDAEKDSALVYAVQQIVKGDYNQTDLDNVRSIAKTLQKNLKAEKKNLSEDNEKLNAQYKTQTERLTSFKSGANPNNEAYVNAIEDSRNSNSKMRSNSEKIAYIQDRIAAAGAIVTQIDFIEKGIDYSLQESTRNIRKLMNELDQKDNALADEVSKIYNTLIENGVDADDSRLAGYSDFKENAKKFEKLREASNNIEDEIEKLYEIYTETGVTENTKKTDEKELEAEREKQESLWKNKWHAHFEQMRKNLKDLPNQKLVSETTDNSIEATKTGILKHISKQERLYVSDMIDFERAFNLLSSHEYKGMVVFSGVSALFLDLFSAIMGWLIYLYRKE